jgi:cobalt-zinc-cadmium efflux system outer membrane protein
MKSLLTVCIVLFVPLSLTRPAVAARQGVTVEELVAIALDRSPAMRAARTETDRAAGERRQAGLRANPQLSTERREEAGGPDNVTMVGASWPLELFRRGARAATAEKLMVVAADTVAEAERQLAAAVRRQAGVVMASLRRAELIDATAASLRETYELLASRVEEGAAAPLVRDQAFVEWRRIEALRPLRRSDAESALIQLKALVGLDPAAALELAGGLESLRAVDPAAQAGQRADVRHAASVAVAAEAALEETRQMGRFDASVFGSYARMNSGFPLFGVNASGATAPIRSVFHNFSLGATITVPIANRNQGAVAAAKAKHAAAAFARDAAALAANADLAAALARDRDAQRAVQIYAGGLRDTAKQNVDVVRESFSLGRLTLADVLNEQRRYLDVEMSYADALAAAFAARADLLQALGVTR